MVGMMLWEPSGHWTRPVTLKEVSVLHIRFLCARMAQDRRRNPLTERRRLRTAGKKLLRQRVEQVVLPAGASAEALPEGLRPVETLPLRRAIAADWCGELLRFRGENPAGARVLITADALSGEVVRTVTELALRHRYLILKVPFGGEELCRRLRREYGVSIVLNPETEREPASVHMAFDPTEAQGDGFCRCMTNRCHCPGSCCRRRWRQGCRRALTGASFCRSCGGPALCGRGRCPCSWKKRKTKGLFEIRPFALDNPEDTYYNIKPW